MVFIIFLICLDHNSLLDITTTSLNIDNLLKILIEWINRLEEQLDLYSGGCPDNFLSNNFVDTNAVTFVQNTSLLQKYNVLLEPKNTPFEYEGKGVGAVRRLWNYLVKQEQLSAYFIKYIFGSTV